MHSIITTIRLINSLRKSIITLTNVFPVSNEEALLSGQAEQSMTKPLSSKDTEEST